MSDKITGVVHFYGGMQFLAVQSLKRRGTCFTLQWRVAEGVLL